MRGGGRRGGHSYGACPRLRARHPSVTLVDPALPPPPRRRTPRRGGRARSALTPASVAAKRRVGAWAAPPRRVAHRDGTRARPGTCGTTRASSAPTSWGTRTERGRAAEAASGLGVAAAPSVRRARRRRARRSPLADLRRLAELRARKRLSTERRRRRNENNHRKVEKQPLSTETTEYAIRPARASRDRRRWRGPPAARGARTGGRTDESRRHGALSCASDVAWEIPAGRTYRGAPRDGRPVRGERGLTNAPAEADRIAADDDARTQGRRCRGIKYAFEIRTRRSVRFGVSRVSRLQSLLERLERLVVSGVLGRRRSRA